MALPNIDILNGITGLEIILSGYILGLILIFKHARKAPNKKVKKNILLSGIGLIALFQAWFGVSASFLLMILGFPPLPGDPNVQVNVQVLSYAWGPALGVPIWAYIVSDLFKKGRYKIPITGIFVILSVIFAILIYAFPSISTKWQASPGGLPSTGITGAALIMLGLMLVIMMVFLGPIVIMTGLKRDDKSAKWRRFLLGIGIIMGAFFGIIDAALGQPEIGLIGLAIVKAGIFTSIFLIYEGIDKGT